MTYSLVLRKRNVLSAKNMAVAAEFIAYARTLPQFAGEKSHFIPIEHHERELPQEGGFALHGYQPDRFIKAPDGSSISIQPHAQERDGWKFVKINNVEYPWIDGRYYVEKFDRWYTDINDLINDQTYRSVLTEPVPELFRNAATNNGEFPITPEFPQGITFSFFRPLRSWMRHKHPDQYQKTIDRVSTLPDREFRIMADPGDHVILAGKPVEDIDTMLKIGQLASLQDFGFIPEGIWLPETAASSAVLERVKANGYSYTFVRSDQLHSTESNPMWVKTPAGELAVFFFDKGESGSLAFNGDKSTNGDEFLGHLRDGGRKSISLGMDVETYGHHKPDRNWFLLYVTSIMQSKYGYKPFDLKEMMGRERKYTELVENSSWSCDHNLGRWNGDTACNCDHPTPAAYADKKLFYDTLTAYNVYLNTHLDETVEGWRDTFVPFYLVVDEAATTPDGDIWGVVNECAAVEGMEILADPETAQYMLAEYYVKKGFTSCGWFFGDTGRVERDIPRFGIATAEKLVPELQGIPHGSTHTEAIVYDIAA